MALPADVRSARILILEDEPGLAAAWSEALTRRGHAVATVAALEAAWRLLSDRNFDLFISDYHVADGVVHDLCLRLRDAGLRLPMILVTAAGEAARVREVWGDDLRGVLTKPVPAGELCGLAEMCLRERNPAGGCRGALASRRERGLLLGELA